MRQCRTCRTHKPVSDFYANRGKPMSDCKECWKLKVRENRARNAEHYRQYEKKRARQPNRVAARAEYQRQNPERITRLSKAWADRNRAKREAQIALSNAVRDGRIEKQPCVVCGSIERIHGHHEDYDRPLDVVWLCPRHHSEYHVVRREAQKILEATA